jgi:surfeit locus 1 family protein
MMPSIAGHSLLRGISAVAPRTVRIPSPLNDISYNNRRLLSTNNATTNTTASFSAGSGVTTTLSSGEGGGGPLGKIFFSSLCVFTFGLGSWQTMRYFDKVEMVQKREEDLKLDPFSSFDDWRSNTLDTTIATKTEFKSALKTYRRVYLHGEFQHQHEILIGPRGPPPGALAESGPNSGRGGGGGMSSSAQGYLVVTPFLVSKNISEMKTDDSKPKRGWFGWISGSRLSEESSTKQSSTGISTKEETIVWVNRGWIPRDYINKYNEIVWSWERPRGTVQLMAMESKTETPGTFAPPSRLEAMNRTTNSIESKSEQKNEAKPECLTCPKPTPPVKKLLWFDRQAMEELTSCSADCHPPLFVEIKTTEKNDENDTTSFPAKASQEFVGEFKVTPAIHAGYAFTWFGLSSAGIYMTRKLLSKGR